MGGTTEIPVMERKGSADGRSIDNVAASNRASLHDRCN
jgi:hypothetical protein